MRELIIDAIYGSHRWRKSWESGEEMPLIREYPNDELLKAYDFFVHGID